MRYLLGLAVIALAAGGGCVHTRLGGGAAPAGPATSAEAEARLPVRPAYVEDRRAVGAQEARGQVIAYLVGAGHADPYRRERAAELERRGREHRLVADAEQAARVEADALQARVRVRAYLIALGARERPPRPAPRTEVPGEPPFPGAAWIAGAWRWEDAEWTWIDGGWRDPEAAGELALGFELGMALEAALGDGGPTLGVRDHRRGGPEAIIRDHRDGKRDEPAPIVRDHRRGGSAAIVRDHRDGKRGDQAPIVRDHRDGKRGDQTPIVRDHREARSEPREAKVKQDDDDRKPTTRDHRR